MTIDRRQLLAGLAAGAGLALAGYAAPRAASLARIAHAAPWPALEAFIARYVADYPVPGAIVAVGRGQEAPRYFADGVTVIGGDVAVDRDTLWRIYSMTKPVTGMAAMMLIEDGALGLDQNIADILPEFAAPRVLTDPDNGLESRPADGPITVRHLLTHTAGLGYSIVSTGPLLAEYRRLGLLPFSTGSVPIEGRIPEPGEENRPASLAVFSERLATVPLIADPGAKWSYSVSLDLLGRVIEVASGIPFDAFLRRRLFDPLGMTSTLFQVPRAKLSRLTASYGIENGTVTLVDPPGDSIFSRPPAFPYGGAGLVTSAQDYDRFLTMLLGEGAIAGVRIMTTDTARLAMSDLLPRGVDKSAMYTPTGFGAGGSVALAAGPDGGAGTYGWGGAAGTIAWVDRANAVRVSGYVQHFPGDVTPFRAGVTRAVYTDLNR